MNEKMKRKIARIQQMEEYFDKISDVFYTKPERIKEDAEIQRMLQELERYFENGQWLADYESDERGELPKELKRGVLSEDGLYNLLCSVEEVK